MANTVVNNVVVAAAAQGPAGVTGLAASVKAANSGDTFDISLAANKATVYIWTYSHATPTPIITWTGTPVAADFLLQVKNTGTSDAPGLNISPTINWLGSAPSATQATGKSSFYRISFNGTYWVGQLLAENVTLA